MRLLTPENPTRLSFELRYARGNDLRRRRAIAALALFAAGTTGVVALRQLGIIRRLPEPPFRPFDAERVVGTKEAYSFFSTPDAFFAVISYATTAALAAMGGANRARNRPIISLTMSAKVLLDCLLAAALLWFQWPRLRAFCIWCLTTSAATFAMLPLAIPEFRKSLATMKEFKCPRTTKLKPS